MLRRGKVHQNEIQLLSLKVSELEEQEKTHFEIIEE